MPNKKPSVAIYGLTSCEGCQVAMLDLHEKFFELTKYIDIDEFRLIEDERERSHYDIAFVEGSISTPKCVERIHDIRRRSKILVALGSCAVTGGINAMKNLHAPEWIKETVYGDDKYLFPSMPVQPVSEVVKVDYVVRGCPMSTPEFLHVLKSLVLGRKPEIFDHAVCVECKLKENECVLDRGMFCLGPISCAGCEAICPTYGQYCTGCRGLVSNVNEKGAVDMLKNHGFSVKEAINRMKMFCAFEIEHLSVK